MGGNVTNLTKKVNFDMIKKRDGWEQIKAVRNGNIFEVKSPIILQPGPAVITHGLSKLSKKFKNLSINRCPLCKSVCR